MLAGQAISADQDIKHSLYSYFFYAKKIDYNMFASCYIIQSDCIKDFKGIWVGFFSITMKAVHSYFIFNIPPPFIYMYMRNWVLEVELQPITINNHCLQQSDFYFLLFVPCSTARI